MQRVVNDCSAITVFLWCLFLLSLPLELLAEDKDLKLIPENISLLNESLLWDKSFEVRAGVGYKDNVLLRHPDPKGSPFVTSGLDASVVRLPLDGLRFYFLLSADDNRYWHEAGVDKEEVVIAVSELQKDFGNNWKAGMVFEYAYQNQVLDVSSLEAGFGTAKVQGHRLMPRPFLRRDFGSRYWLQLEFVSHRQIWREPLDSYWQIGPKITLGHDFGKQSQATLSYMYGKLLYDTREQDSAAGDPIPATSLKLLLQRAELEWRQYWGQAEHWRTTSKFA